MSLSREYTEEEINNLNQKSVQLHEALFEMNENSISTIIEILTTTTNEERQLIRSNYKKINNHPIQMDIISQLSENFRLLSEICINMFDTPYEYDARELNKVLSVGMGIEEDNLIEVFCTRPKDYLEIVDKAYKNFFGISLKEEIKNQFQEQFSSFLLAIMETERPLEQTITDIDKAYQIAEEIDEKGINTYATDINLFKKTFLERSREDLILISRAFYEKVQKNLYDVFEEESVEQKSLFDEKEEEKKLRNKNIKLIKGILFCVIAPAQYFAKKCIGALSGFSTDIRTLSRVLITREEIDMEAIRDYYFQETKSNLTQDIENEYICQNDEIGKILIELSNK